MSMRRITTVQAVLLVLATLANAAPNGGTIRIKVLDSETRSMSLGGNDVPKNCDGLTYDAYCNSSRAAILTNTLLVQEDDGPPFRIACTSDSKFSRCIPLPKGESFNARREKRGITVYYEDDNGKERKQSYMLVASDAKTATPASPAAVAPQPSPAPRAAAPAQSSPAPAPSATSAPVAAAPSPAVAAQEAVPTNVKCNFSSTPPGAEITLDEKYVGSTPSEITVTTGTHVVAFSMPGFATWKRDLTVIPGSELTVSAILQKQ